MTGGRVVRVEGWGWVAADDAGWTDKVYETEAEARAAVGLSPFPAHQHTGDAHDPDRCVYTLPNGERCMHPLPPN